MCTFVPSKAKIMPDNNPILTEKAAKPLGLYPHSRKVGNLLFLSGIGPRKAGTDEIPGLKLDKYGNYLEFDFEAQVRSAFDNVKTVLEESGSSWDAMPCRTTVEVSSLPSSISIELKCMATI